MQQNRVISWLEAEFLVNFDLWVQYFSKVTPDQLHQVWMVEFLGACWLVSNEQMLTQMNSFSDTILNYESKVIKYCWKGRCLPYKSGPSSIGFTMSIGMDIMTTTGNVRRWSCYTMLRPVMPPRLRKSWFPSAICINSSRIRPGHIWEN